MQMPGWVWKSTLPAASVLVLFACVSARVDFADLAGTTWLNKDYPVGREDMRMAIVSGTEIQLFDSPTSEKPKLIKRIRITKTWKDDKGDLWFRDIAERKWAASAEYTGGDYFELNRFSQSMTVWEITSGQDDYPSEMGFAAGAYSIRYRQE
jgi:hypothetical protein